MGTIKYDLINYQHEATVTLGKPVSYQIARSFNSAADAMRTANRETLRKAHRDALTATRIASTRYVPHPSVAKYHREKAARTRP